MENSLGQETHLEEEINTFQHRLDHNGLEDALRYLSGRTPHRFTGIYKYAGNTLRNLFLFDSLEDAMNKGEDAPMEATYCSLVQHTKEQALEISDAAEDVRVKGIVITPVVSYCGVLLKNSAGEPFGTLCHFDMQRCQERVNDLPLLQAASTLLYQHLLTNGLLAPE